MKRLGPNMRTVAPMIVGGVLLGAAISFAGSSFSPAIDAKEMLAQVLLIVGGALVGVAIALYIVAMNADDDLRQEAQQAARELVDKETFGGFRRH